MKAGSNSLFPLISCPFLGFRGNLLQDVMRGNQQVNEFLVYVRGFALRRALRKKRGHFSREYSSARNSTTKRFSLKSYLIVPRIRPVSTRGYLGPSWVYLCEITREDKPRYHHAPNPNVFVGLCQKLRIITIRTVILRRTSESLRIGAFFIECIFMGTLRV